MSISMNQIHDEAPSLAENTENSVERVLVIGTKSALENAADYIPDGFEGILHCGACGPDSLADLDFTAENIVFLMDKELDPATYSAAVVEKMTGGNVAWLKSIFMVPQPHEDEPAYIRLLRVFHERGTLKDPPEDLIKVMKDPKEIRERIKANAHIRKNCKPASPDMDDQVAASCQEFRKVEQEIEEVAQHRIREGDLREDDFKVCVFLSASTTDPETLSTAYTIGRMIASIDGSLVFGASYVGAMAEVARGAYDAKAHVTGITLPRFAGELLPEHVKNHVLKGYKKPDEQLVREGRTVLSRLHVLPTIKGRVARMMECSDGLVVMDGGAGTFEELAYAARDFLTTPEKMEGKRIFVLNRNGMMDEAITIFRDMGLKEGKDFVVSHSLEGGEPFSGCDEHGAAGLYDQLAQFRHEKNHCKPIDWHRRLPKMPARQKMTCKL